MKKIISGLLVSSATLGLGLSVRAATTVNDDKSVTSDATITVTEGTDVTPPENENKPGGETGQQGPLSIDNVIVFNFEDMKLSGRTQQISLKNDGTNSSAKRNIQVTDTRGTGAGWDLQIKQSPLVNANKEELKGAYISMMAGKVEAGSQNVSPELAPTTQAYGDEGTLNSSLAPIFTAAKGNGLGTWISWYNSTAEDPKGTVTDVQLNVPSGNKTGDYSGTVTWVLNDNPGASEAQ